MLPTLSVHSTQPFHLLMLPKRLQSKSEEFYIILAGIFQTRKVKKIISAFRFFFSKNGNLIIY